MLLHQLIHEAQIKFGFHLPIEVVLRHQLLKRQAPVYFERLFFLTQHLLSSLPGWVRTPTPHPCKHI